MLSGRRKKEVRKKTPEQMGKVLYWIAAERAAEARKQYVDEKHFPATAVTVYSILYNLAFLRMALFRKYSDSVVNEVHCLAIDELDRQYGKSIPEITSESVLDLARQITYSACSCLDDAAQGDQSALYRLAKQYLRDISAYEADEIQGADILISTCALLAGWIDSYYINEVYEIVSEDLPVPKVAGAPASTASLVVPAVHTPPAQKYTAPAAPAVPAPAPPKKAPVGRRALKYAACLLVLGLIVYSGYAYNKITLLEQELTSSQKELEKVSDNLNDAEDHLDTLQNRVLDLTGQLNSAERQLEFWQNFYNGYYDSPPVYSYYDYNTYASPSYSYSETWVWVSQHGTKYHRTSSCSNMGTPIYTPLSKAVSQGYTRCSKCW